ncbi:MAG TPA: rhodanese-like domain-containing protein [Acidimicrobiales bacterium]|nr:rhodanese-like domain-containing protein [Acidimicrobiales bacterium]
MSISENGVPQVTPQEGRQRVEDGALLLDVREPDEWEAGHAPAAVHLPLGRVEAGDHGDVALEPGRPVVVICRVGGRSEKAAVALKAAGFEAVNLAGGMRAWAEAGQPVVKDDGEIGTVI